MRSEYPSGLVLGPGIGRSPVRFPARARSVWGNLFINFWYFFIIFGMSWDVSGSGLGMFLDGRGMVLTKCRMGSKAGYFQKWPGVCFLSRAI